MYVWMQFDGPATSQINKMCDVAPRAVISIFSSGPSKGRYWFFAQYFKPINQSISTSFINYELLNKAAMSFYSHFHLKSLLRTRNLWSLKKLKQEIDSKEDNLDYVFISRSTVWFVSPDLTAGWLNLKRQPIRAAQRVIGDFSSLNQWCSSVCHWIKPASY